MSNDYEIYLGKGGEQPGLALFNQGRNRIEEAISLPQGHSVYALDVNEEAGLLAFGSRGGRLYCLPYHSQEEKGKIELYHRCQGQLLSVCVINESLVCSADSTGQCLLWLIHADDCPVTLSNAGKIICSLALIDEIELVGLSTDGCLLVWSVPEGRLTKCIQGPKPAPKYALVEMQYWQERKLLIYPGDAGKPAMWDLQALNPYSLPAHRGDCYVTFILEDHLITIGANDRECCMWDVESKKSLYQIRLPWPNSIVAGVPLDAGKKTMILIDSTGKALSCRIKSNEVEFLQEYEGGCYRVLASSGSSNIKQSAVVPNEEQRARELLARAQDMIESNDFEPVEGVCAELHELGYEKAVLGLKARMAMLRNNVLEELGYRHRLYELMKNLKKIRRDFLERYVALLEELWMVPRAWEISRLHLNSAGGNTNDCWLQQAAHAMSEPGFLVEPGVSLSSVISASTCIGQVLSGNWIVKRISCQTLPNDSSAMQFAQFYNQISEDKQYDELMGVQVESVPCISRGSIRQVDIVKLTRSSSSGLIRALCFQKVGNDIILLQMIMVSALNSGSESRTVDLNNELLSVFRQAEQNDFEIGESWKIQAVITAVLRRCWTMSCWRQNVGKDIEHEQLA